MAQNLHLLGSILLSALNGDMPHKKPPKAKPKQGKPNPFRNYYENNTHLLSIYDTDRNLAKLASRNKQ